MSLLLRLVSLALLAQLVITRSWDKERIVVDDIPKPNTVNFNSCYNHLEATRWICWDKSARTFNTDFERMLQNWPQARAECCAIWNSEDCIQLKAAQYPRCNSFEVIDYYKRVHDKFISNGCGRFSPDRYDCNSFNSTTISIFALITIFVMIHLFH